MTASASLKFPLYSGVEPLIFKALPLSSFCNLPHDKLDPRRMARRSFVRLELQFAIRRCRVPRTQLLRLKTSTKRKNVYTLRENEIIVATIFLTL